MKSAIAAIMMLLPVLILGAGSVTPVWATGPTQGSSRFSDDTVFNQIELTREGVTAVDTLGNHWVYNFDSNVFVPDKEAGEANQRSERSRQIEMTPDPVEQRCIQQKTVKSLQKTVLVGYDEYVNGGIVALGRVVVKGWVKGDVQSLNGRVLVTESGRIDGDVKAPEIIVNEGGSILGDQMITGPLDITGEVLRKPFTADGVIIVIGFIIFLCVSTFLILALFPRQFRRIESCIIEYKLRTYLIGLMLVFLIWFPVAVLAITIVGIILIPFVPVVYLAAIAVGTAAFGRYVGRLLLEYLGRGGLSPWFETYLGILLFMVLWMVDAVLLGSSANGSTGWGFGLALLVIAILISTIPILCGLGGAFLTRFGFREYLAKEREGMGRGHQAPAPAPPPIPQMPGMVMPPPVAPLTPMPEVPRTDRPGPLEQPGSESGPKPPLPSGGQ